MITIARSLYATSSSRVAMGIALAVAGTTPAFAQDIATEASVAAAATAVQDPAPVANGEEGGQEIVVTGFRAALQSAVSTKKRSEQIVESVSAEDIGKLPDQSIAEAIARLPGLTSQRLPGSGRSTYISIRGLGPDFSTTTLNGRLQTSTGDVRNVEYDQYPSEIVSGVDIYKTPNAGLVGQGLVGSVNIKTIRPLDYGKRVLAVGVKGILIDQDKLNPEADRTGYRFNGTYVDQLADDRLGVAFSVSYANEPYGVKEERSWGWPNAGPGGEPAIGGLVSFNNSTTVKRLGLTGTLQYEVSPTLTATIDGFYSKFEDEQLRRGVEIPLIWGGASLSNAVVEDGIVRSGTFTNVPSVVNNHAFEREADLYSFGGNLNYDGENGWKGFVDFGWSKTDRTELILETNAGTGPGAAGANDTVDVTILPNGRIVVTNNVIDYSDPNQIFITDPNGWGGGAPTGRQHGYRNNRIVEDEIKQLSGQLERELGGGFLKAVRAGGSYVVRDKSLTPDEAYLNLTGGALQAAVPSQYLMNPINSWVGLGPVITYDPRDLLDDGFFVELPNTGAGVLAKGFDLTEKVGSLFLMADLNKEFSSGVLTGNIGVRAEHTKQRSDGFRVVPGTGPGTGVQPYSDGDKFWDVLPSANLNFRFNSDWVLRIAGAREIMRPRMDDMASNFSYGFNTTLGIISGSSGNPRLRPYRAWALDLSIEKYWGTKGYVSAQLFWKNLDSIIYTQSVEFDWADFPNLDPRATTTIGLIDTPVNATGGKIYGIEVAGTLPFETFTPALEGFGLTGGVSYTVPRIRPGAGAPREDIPGYSRWVANGTAYFERYGFNARGSIRYRSDYRGDFSGFGASRERRRIKAETIVDAQIGYDFQQGSALEGLSVFVQGLNLTDEPLISHEASNSALTLNYETYGRRFMLGATYKF